MWIFLVSCGTIHALVNINVSHVVYRRVVNKLRLREVYQSTQMYTGRRRKKIPPKMTKELVSSFVRGTPARIVNLAKYAYLWQRGGPRRHFNDTYTRSSGAPSHTCILAAWMNTPHSGGMMDAATRGQQGESVHEQAGQHQAQDVRPIT